MRWRVLLQEPLHDPPLAEAMMIFNLVEESEEEEEEEEEEWGHQQSALLLYLIDHKKRGRKWKILNTNYFAKFNISADGLRQKYHYLKAQEETYNRKGRDSREGKEFMKILRRLEVIQEQDSESSDEEEKREVSRPGKRKRKK